jgi:hypothetical protein
VVGKKLDINDLQQVNQEIHILRLDLNHLKFQRLTISEFDRQRDSILRKLGEAEQRRMKVEAYLSKVTKVDEVQKKVDEAQKKVDEAPTEVSKAKDNYMEAFQELDNIRREIRNGFMTVDTVSRLDQAERRKMIEETKFIGAQEMEKRLKSELKLAQEMLEQVKNMPM